MEPGQQPRHTEFYPGMDPNFGPTLVDQKFEDTDEHEAVATKPPEKRKIETDPEFEKLVAESDQEMLLDMGYILLPEGKLVDWQAGKCPLPKDTVVTIVRYPDKENPGKSLLYYNYGDEPTTHLSEDEKESGKRRYLFVVKETSNPNGKEPLRKMIHAQEIEDRVLPVFTDDRNREHRKATTKWRKSSLQEMNSIILNPNTYHMRYVTILTNAPSDNQSAGEYYIMPTRMKPGDDVASLDANLERDGFRILMWEKKINIDTNPVSAKFDLVKNVRPLTSLSQSEVEAHIDDIFREETRGERARISVENPVNSQGMKVFRRSTNREQRQQPDLAA